MFFPRYVFNAKAIYLYRSVYYNQEPEDALIKGETSQIDNLLNRHLFI